MHAICETALIRVLWKSSRHYCDCVSLFYQYTNGTGMELQTLSPEDGCLTSPRPNGPSVFVRFPVADWSQKLMRYSEARYEMFWWTPVLNGLFNWLDFYDNRRNDTENKYVFTWKHLHRNNESPVMSLKQQPVLHKHNHMLPLCGHI